MWILKAENWWLWTVHDFFVLEPVFFLSKMISSTQLKLSVKKSPGCLRQDSSLWRLDRLLVKTHFKRSGNLPTPVSVGNKISRMTTGMSTCLTTGGRGESNTFFQNRLTLLASLKAEGKLWAGNLEFGCSTTSKWQLYEAYLRGIYFIPTSYTKARKWWQC